MHRILKPLFQGMVVATCAALAATASVAQEYPAKQVRIIVPYGAGTATDAVARALAQKLGTEWKRGVFVENVTGAGGVVGTQAVQRADPDGHTIGLVASGHVMNKALYPNLPFDPIKDFTPVMNLAVTPMVILATPGAYSSMKDFLDKARAKPGSIDYGSTGNGSLPHMTIELIRIMGGLQINHIPYRNTGQMMPDLLSGRVSVASVAVASAIPQVQSGKLVALAVSTPERSKFLPNVPAMSEFLPGYDISPWIGLIAPRGTPAAIVEKINAQVTAAMRSPDVLAVLNTSGLTPQLRPATDFWRDAEAELPKWQNLVKQGGIKAE